MDVLFTREGLTGMLEAADVRKIDKIPQFLRVLMDRVSDKMETCHITTMSTYYVDIMADVCRITKPEKWKEEELAMLQNESKTF